MDAYLSSHAPSWFRSAFVFKQLSAALGLRRVEHFDVFGRGSAQQGQAGVQPAVAQALNPHLGIEVYRGDVLGGKGHVLWSILLIFIL